MILRLMLFNIRPDYEADRLFMFIFCYKLHFSTSNRLFLRWNKKKEAQNKLFSENIFSEFLEKLHGIGTSGLIMDIALLHVTCVFWIDRFNVSLALFAFLIIECTEKALATQPGISFPKYFHFYDWWFESSKFGIVNFQISYPYIVNLFY